MKITCKGRKGYVVVENNVLNVVTGRGHVDCPTLDSRGNLLWDFPERVPRYLKAAARREFRFRRSTADRLANDHTVSGETMK